MVACWVGRTTPETSRTANRCVAGLLVALPNCNSVLYMLYSMSARRVFCNKTVDIVTIHRPSVTASTVHPEQCTEARLATYAHTAC